MRVNKSDAYEQQWRSQTRARAIVILFNINHPSAAAEDSVRVMQESWSRVGSGVRARVTRAASHLLSWRNSDCGHTAAVKRVSGPVRALSSTLSQR